MSAPSYFHSYADAVTRALAATEVSEGSETAIHAPGVGLEKAVAVSRRLGETNGTLFFCGNGASSAMAGHMALDWLKAGGLKAISFNDPAVLTAVANDTGYENTFSLPVSRLGSPQDVLVCVSSSGRSPNVLAAIATARQVGMAVITFSGLGSDNPARRLGNLNFYVPCRTYGVAECCHQVLLHAWLDYHLGLKEWAAP